MHASVIGLISECVTDEGVAAVVVERDSSEFARLSQLGDVLGLSPIEIGQVHSQLAEQAYRSQVQQVCSFYTQLRSDTLTLLALL